MQTTELANKEDQVIKDILNGNNDGYRLLVNRYAPMVFHVIRKYEKDEDEVEDLAQQVFVNAYEQLASFKGNSKFSSWLHMIASNLCKDYIKNIRRTNVQFSEMDQGQLETTLCDLTTPCQDIETDELQHLLNQAIEQLTIEYSEPFLLKYRDGLSYDVISERLGVSVSALKVRAHRARKELKTFIENRENNYGQSI